MIDTVIVSGGDIRNDFALDFLKKIIKETEREQITLIAADKGLEFFMQTDMKPDVAVGDFDSLSNEGKKFLEQAEQLEIIRLKPEKDDSDTQSAVNLAIHRGAEEIVILGATGDRVDHVLANIGLLKLGKELGVSVTLLDSKNKISLVENGTVLKRTEQFGQYVSFFSLGTEVTGLTLKGFKYPLRKHDLSAADSGLTVSNEIAEETAAIYFEKGTLLMIMSRD